MGEDIQAYFGQGNSILEVGCGSGLIYEEMLRRAVLAPDSYIGGDVSEKMLEIARARYPKVDFRHLDIFDLSFAATNVVCIQVLQHLPYYQEALRNLVRITAKKLYIMSWFIPESEDQLLFDPPTFQFDGARSFENRYSLPKFLAYLLLDCGKSIHELRVHHFDGIRYSVAVTFE